MAHPSSSYVKYLIVQAHARGAVSYDRIVFTLNRLDIIRVDEGEFKFILDGIKFPDNLQFWNTDHKETADFMRQLGIYDLWNPEPTMGAEFLRLLQMPPVIDTMRVLLLGHIEAEEISEKLKFKHKVSISANAINMYRQHLWNVDGSSFSEWIYVFTYYPHDMCNMMRAAYVGTPGQALYRAGFNPVVEGKKSMKEAHRALHFRLEATRSMIDSKDTADTVAKLSREVINIYQALCGEGSGMEETLRQFKNFEMTTNKADVTPVNEIAPAGNYSRSGTTKKEKSK